MFQAVLNLPQKVAVDHAAAALPFEGQVHEFRQFFILLVGLDTLEGSSYLALAFFILWFVVSSVIFDLVHNVFLDSELAFEVTGINFENFMSLQPL